ncbi:MAG: hypothetical protein RBU37_18775 [Myxococcota bacterium]|nr:hypothetical protein [Myxococcota bacterium]
MDRTPLHQEEVGGTGQAPIQQEVRGTGQAPIQQEVRGTGQAPIQQEVRGTGQAPIQQEVQHEQPSHPSRTALALPSTCQTQSRTTFFTR